MTVVEPVYGERTEIAVRVAYSMLGDGEWNNHDFVVWAMCKAADIKPKTARNRLGDLVRRGEVERRRTPTGRWQVRLTEGSVVRQ